jgi:thioredoxin-like negative regulator of GroEL
MIQNTSAPHGPRAATPVDTTAFAAFGMREVNGETIDAAVAAAGDDLVCVFFWGVDCFNCEMAKKAMLAQPAAVRELGLRWLHANVYAHPELGQRFGLHGIPVFMFFHRGKKLGRATGWHGHAQFAAAVANARNKLAGKPLV